MIRRSLLVLSSTRSELLGAEPSTPGRRPRLDKVKQLTKNTVNQSMEFGSLLGNLGQGWGSQPCRCLCNPSFPSGPDCPSPNLSLAWWTFLLPLEGGGQHPNFQTAQSEGTWAPLSHESAERETTASMWDALQVGLTESKGPEIMESKEELGR